MKAKATSEYHNESTQPKGSISRTCTKIFQEFEKVAEIERRASVMKYILYKIASIQHLYWNLSKPFVPCNLETIRDNFWS